MTTAHSEVVELLKARIIATLEPFYVEVVDQSGGCGEMIEATIVSERFKDKRSLDRHRIVNAALKDEINKIHAFSQKTYTREEWEKKKPQE